MGAAIVLRLDESICDRSIGVISWPFSVVRVMVGEVQGIC